MAAVELVIGGRRYPVACRDGEEDKLRQAAAGVDRKVRQATASLGGMSEVRQLLLASLLLAADQLEMEAAAAREDATPLLEAVAERLERAAGLLAEHASEA